VEPQTEATEQAETPLEALASMATIIAIALFVFSFVFQNFEIPSGSMEKTLLIGDHVVVDRSTLAPPTTWAKWMHYRPVQHGDIIVFMKPRPETPDLILVKRAIGLPGDRIHLRGGVVYRNGVALNEPYAAMPTNDGNPNDAYTGYRDDFPADLPGIEQASIENNAAEWAEELPSHIQGEDIVVPPGTVFAMGDNRVESLDSRFWGFVPMENIMGRPMFVYWSFETPADQENKTSIADRLGFMVHIVLHIFTETRWARTLHVVR
jgi:signal peptidase I